MNNTLSIESNDLLSSHILIVDDEPANVILMEGILDSQGYSHVISTQDSRQVEPLFLEHSIDLILLDINMPHLDGYEVMQKLKPHLENDSVPILVLTAQSTSEFCQRALDGGAQDYVTKPFHVREVLSRVHNLLKVRQAFNYMRNQKEILEKEVFKRTEELEHTRLQVVRRLGQAAEYRDNETGLHIVRMSKISAIIGKAAGLSDYECNLILNASTMHDIGKIGISDSVLLKPGSFNAEEWEIMKTHVTIGAEILSNDDSDLMLMAYDIALNHHEKWNGKGYPNGIKGDEIPLSARIAAIADVFDALISKRPYKSAWPLDKAIEFILQRKNEDFDPFLVDCFEKVLPELININEKYAEPDE